MYISPSARVSAAYRQVDLNSLVMSASPYGLIGLLYKELQACLLGAKAAMERKDVACKVRLLGKAARILDEGLTAGLDMRVGGELAVNLHRLYSYCLMRLAEANVKNDAAVIDDVLLSLRPVIDGWTEIGNQVQA